MNDALKIYARANKVYLYEVAEKLNMRPAEFSVQYMRHRLNEEEEAKLLEIIDRIAKEKRDEEKSKAV